MPKISGNEQTDQINKGQSRETEENGRVYIRGLGSFLADAAAEGEWQIIREHFPQVKTHTVILKDIMDEILPLGSWHWMDESGKLVIMASRRE
jgi:hypothetical protein